jgi:multisubunit Na+/H+ antiporter MnhG subunit
MIEPSNAEHASVIIGAGAIIVAILFWILKSVAAHAIGAALWAGIKAGWKASGKKGTEDQ